jgi:holo-[acyl-carrier protein] synthase
VALIVGVGIEWLDVPRFEALEARFGERLRERLFTAGERAFAARKARGHESLAVRLAAKIAARKALGLVHGRWQDIEVRRERGQAPTLHFYGAAARAATALGVAHVALTLTHDAAACIGQVVLESPEPAATSAPPELAETLS